MSRDAFDAAPPRAGIAFRVGIVGHRPDRLPANEDALAEIRQRIAEVLEAVANAVTECARGPNLRFYDAGLTPALTAVSPLAEGADRIFAEEALRCGYRLTCVMPFHRDEFKRDFAGPESFEEASAARFDAILVKAEQAGALTSFELDGRRERAHEAYGQAGRVVLNQSDLLLAVWDGGSTNGIGGTFDTIQQAIAFNVPTLWLDSRSPFGWKLLRDEADLEAITGETDCAPCPRPVDGALNKAIDEVVRAELGLGGSQGDQLDAYLAETRPKRNWAMTWKLFRDFMDLGRIRPPAIRVADFQDQIRSGWPVIGDPDVAEGDVAPDRSWMNGQLRRHYAWSDKLADLYADAHRSAFVASSLMAAAAVFTALLPVAGHFGRQAALGTAIIEALILALLVGLPVRARSRRWHEKWLEYRVLAELVRELRILIPFGGARPLPRTAAHLSNYGDPARSWMNWQARAIARRVGLPNARIDKAYVIERCAELLEFLGTASPEHGQIGFHAMNCHRMERIHQRLHRMSLILFAVTIAAVAANWAFRLNNPDLPERVTAWLILFSAFLPSLGAAFASINNQGEFARLQRRANAMAQSLTALRNQIMEMIGSAEGPSLAHVSELAAQLASMMVDENTEWRIVVLDLPHVAG
ncbi:MAG TPA: hypothetical protein VGF71_02025 [Caulobacteraceae bacterium]|jgi:hypothetical protein